MAIQTLQWVGGLNGYLKLIDQTALPTKKRYRICRDWPTVFRAIQRLEVRGAPAIGVAAAYGLVLGIRTTPYKSLRDPTGQADYADFHKKLKRVAKKLSLSRPTAVNLKWALDRMAQTARTHKNKPIAQLKNILFREAKRIHAEDRQVCLALGRYGARLIKNGSAVLTYCNAGSLATGGSGTALSAFYQAKRQRKKFRVYAPETRPLLQGARLTTWELSQAGIDVTLLCDNMIARLMQTKKISCVILGSDRVAANGDAANKIGTYGVARLAHAHKIPFYVVIPTSSLDRTLKNGSRIPIEYRSEHEVTTIAGKRLAAKGIKVYNPAFDVTPAKYITAIVTEYGIIKPPYQKNIRKLCP